MIHFLIRAVLYIALAGCLSSAIYYFICLWTAAAFSQRRQRPSLPVQANLPPVSILKPLKGTDPEIYDSFRSHCLQDYPEYEIIFGVSDLNDSAIESVMELQREFPDRRIQLMVSPKILGANVKVSNLAQMVAEARYDYL